MGVPVLRIDQSDESPQETPLVIVFFHEDGSGPHEFLNVMRFHVASEKTQKVTIRTKSTLALCVGCTLID